MREEEVIQSQYCQFLASLDQETPISLLTISHWCGFLYTRKEAEGPLLDATLRALNQPWARATPAARAGRARWARAEARARAWWERRKALGRVWYHALRRDPGLFQRGMEARAGAEIRRAAQDVALGYAALLLPPLGRTWRSAPHGLRVPAAVWAVVAGFCVGTAAEAVAWRAVAGGEWSLGLWHMGRDLWMAPGGEGLQLPGVGTVARLLGASDLGVPRLLRMFECAVEVAPAAAS